MPIQSVKAPDGRGQSFVFWLPFNLWATVYLYLTSDNLPYEKIGDEVRSLADLAPFEIPLSWEWCRVGDLFSNISGLAYKKDALAIKADKMIRVLRGGNIGEEQFLFKGDDVFISSEFVKPELYLRKNYMITPAVSSLDHIGKIALIDKDYSDTVVGGFVLMLIPHFNDDVVSQYLLYAFATKHHRDNCRNITHKSGQAFYNLSREQMMNLPVPIPPREEMERIIAMLKRVLPKVADYAVVDTALQNLNDSFPEALKKSILQEAVQGKLVPQDPSDEPAEDLLERIRAEKQRLIKEGKIKKDKHESVIFRRDNSHYEKLGGVERCIDDELPFEIPENWCWCKIGTIFTLQAEKKHWEHIFIQFQNTKRKSGGTFSIHDHIRAMVYSFLSAGISWERMESGIDLVTGRILSIDEVFHQYDPEYLLQCRPEELRDQVKHLGYASQYTRKQMTALVGTNIGKLQQLDEQYGGIDVYYHQFVEKDPSFKTLVKSLSILIRGVLLYRLASLSSSRKYSSWFSADTVEAKIMPSTLLDIRRRKSSLSLFIWLPYVP